jgi:hypothetical protein
MRALTVTRSPRESGLAGRKLAPGALAYASSRPRRVPLREPTTDTPDIWGAGVPRKLICVSGEASGLPLSGDTVRASTGQANSSAPDATNHHSRTSAR